MNSHIARHSPEPDIVVLDGVYYLDDRKQIRFKRLPPPGDAEVARVTACIARRISLLLERRGLGSGANPEEADPLPRDQPLLAELYAGTVRCARSPKSNRKKR